MRKLLGHLIALGFAAALLAAPSAGAVVLTLKPSAATVSAGDALDVDVIVSELGAGVPPSVGAFDLDVAFDSLLFAPTGVDFGPFLGDPLTEALTDFSFAVDGIVDFAEVSLLSPAELDALQPAEFLLATLHFTALADGSGSFGFAGERRVDDAFGAKLPIPAPGVALLLASGLLLIPWRNPR